jgi:hypothetical protein
LKERDTSGVASGRPGWLPMALKKMKSTKGSRLDSCF